MWPLSSSEIFGDGFEDITELIRHYSHWQSAAHVSVQEEVSGKEAGRKGKLMIIDNGECSEQSTH
jgi:hypothetical protein